MEPLDPMIQERRSLTGFAKLIVLQPPKTLPNQPTKAQEEDACPSQTGETSNPPHPPETNAIQS